VHFYIFGNKYHRTRSTQRVLTPTCPGETSPQPTTATKHHHRAHQPRPKRQPQDPPSCATRHTPIPAPFLASRTGAFRNDSTEMRAGRSEAAGLNRTGAAAHRGAERGTSLHARGRADGV